MMDPVSAFSMEPASWVDTLDCTAMPPSPTTALEQCKFTSDVEENDAQFFLASSASEDEATFKMDDDATAEMDTSSAWSTMDLGGMAVMFASDDDECGSGESDELALTPPGEPRPTSNAITSGALPQRRGRKRPAADASATASTPTTEQPNNEMKWQKLIELLGDETFLPGQRPDRIEGTTVPPELMYKEMPKRRRPHSLPTHPRDKWYNTGGIKSASDRFDRASNLGLRKRYGKVVREHLPVLRFHEYTLLTRDAKTGELKEQKGGPTLFYLVPEATKRPKVDTLASSVASGSGSGAEEDARSTAAARKQLAVQEKQLEIMRAQEATLQLQLAEAKLLIKQQAEALASLQQEGATKEEDSSEEKENDSASAAGNTKGKKSAKKDAGRI